MSDKEKSNYSYIILANYKKGCIPFYIKSYSFKIHFGKEKSIMSPRLRTTINKSEAQTFSHLKDAQDLVELITNTLGNNDIKDYSFYIDTFQ